jgi:serine/threonine protein kinase
MAKRLHLLRITAILGRGNLTETLVADVVDDSRAGKGRSAVVKRLHPNLANDPAAMARIIEEARVLARLRHPLVPAFIGVGDDHGLPFFAQAPIDGMPLPDDLTVTWEETLAIVLDVVDALAHAHGCGVIHRDLSRRNLLLDRDGRTHLIDFGIARADDRPRRTRTGAVVGTPSTMAPEQALGEEPRATVDVWALGIIGHSLLTGHHPLGITGDDSPGTRLQKVREATPAPLAGQAADDVPEDLQRLLMDCLQRDPTRRPQDAGALLGALQAVRLPPGGLLRARATLGQQAARWLAAAAATSGAMAWPETLDD